MRIAFTHNLQLTDSEEEAEFDRPETVAAITESLRRLGHEVEPVEVSGPASRVVARLEALAPELIFNTAEGTHGRFREAFFPALFDRLAMPFTGSDAWVCALTLDKQLAKMVLAAEGVPVPRGALITSAAQLERLDLRFPVIVKPNYEGSSIGITVDSVVESKAALEARAAEALRRFPTGLLVEEFIVGRDVVVPWMEKASPATGGVLEPSSYEYDPEYTAGRKYQLYDYDLKSVGFNAVDVATPANMPPESRERVMEHARTVARVLGLRDVARSDFRLAEDGELYFLEVNALPSLEHGASLYVAGALAGLKTQDDVLGAIVRSAAERYGLPYAPRRTRRVRRTRLKVGLTYNVRQPGEAESNDSVAEYDTPETIAALRKAVESYGHEVVELEATPELPAILPSAGVDTVFNIAEGFAGRSRESQVPALLDLLGIPYTGSEPAALTMALDKGLAKRIVAQEGVHTPPFFLMTTGKERLPKGMEFPVIAKPVAEGSSKGLLPTSVVEDEKDLRELAREMARRYRQAVIVEGFLPGREFTLAMLGEKRPRVLPPLEVLFTNPDQKNPIYSYTSKFAGGDIGYAVPADVDEGLRRELERVARTVFSALDCRDYARVDVRLDAKGRVNFIECNPLPGIAPGFSDFCVIAEAAGMDYRTLVGEIMAPAIRRWRERRKERLLAGRW